MRAILPLVDWIVAGERPLWKTFIGIFTFYILFVVASLTIGYIEAAIDESVHNSAIVKTVETDKKVQELITVIRYESGVDLIAVMRYHNGRKGLNGFSFIRKSLTNISKKDFLNFDRTEFEGLPVTADLHMLESHLKNKCVTNLNNSTLQHYSLFLRNGVGRFATCPIFDNGTLIGAIVSVTTDGREVNLPLLQTQAAKLQGIIVL